MFLCVNNMSKMVNHIALVSYVMHFGQPTFCLSVESIGATLKSNPSESLCAFKAWGDGNNGGNNVFSISVL